MVTSTIPVENIYYLLCYAWDSLEEANLLSVSTKPETQLAELFARVLSSGVSHLLKRGLDRSYLTYDEEIAGIRGRVDIGASLKRTSFLRARASCTFDELSPDILHNRIIKTMLRRLANVADLDRTLAEQLRDLYRRMPGIGEMRLTASSFRRVVLGRNNAFYRFLLDVCEIAHQNLLVNETRGGEYFRDFTRDDDQMARLFEKFLYRFYEKEQSTYVVSAPRFVWRASGDPADLAYLPQMRTDIVLRSGTETIVIDAKYYAATLAEHMTKVTVRSGHLYQLFAYMQHLTIESSSAVRGMLIYPRTTRTVRVRATLFNHPFEAATINLAQPWDDIRRDLLGLLPQPTLLV